MLAVANTNNIDVVAAPKLMRFNFPPFYKCSRVEAWWPHLSLLTILAHDKYGYC